jgi:hypothetical protein
VIEVPLLQIEVKRRHFDSDQSWLPGRAVPVLRVAAENGGAARCPPRG